MRILVIEDDATLARFVMKGLREAGFAVDHAGNGEDGLRRAANERRTGSLLVLPRGGQGKFAEMCANITQR